MLTVHHLNNSRAHRVLWLLEELGLPYEIRHYQRDANLRAPESLRAIHPLGKANQHKRKRTDQKTIPRSVGHDKHSSRSEDLGASRKTQHTN